MDCTGHKLVERMPSATSDSKHRVANLQRGGIDWISFPFPSPMDKCYQPSAQHPSGAWNSAAAKQRSHRFVTGSRLCYRNPGPRPHGGVPRGFLTLQRLPLPSAYFTSFANTTNGVFPFFTLPRSSSSSSRTSWMKPSSSRVLRTWEMNREYLR